jgi:SPP1 gp7 family putative phage head morphogenesis protein
MSLRTRMALVKLAQQRQEAVTRHLVARTPAVPVDDAELSVEWLEEFRRRTLALGNGMAWIRMAIAAQLNGVFIAAWTLKREGVPIVPGLRPVAPAAEFTAFEDLESAAEYWKRSVPLTDAEYERVISELESFARAAAQQTGQLAVHLADIAGELLDKAFREQWSLFQFRKEFAERIGGISKNTLESMFRTQMARRYGGTRSTVIRNAGAGMVPFLQYISIPDARRTPICKAMHLYTAAAVDPVWDLWTPPNHWQCRSDISPIVYPEAVRMGIAERWPDGTIHLTRGARPFGDPPKTTEDERGNLVDVIPQDGFRAGEKSSARRAA